MKWPRNKRTENQGVLYVKTIVNEHGSIFHPIHGEADIGIDCHIELVEAEKSTGKLVAVQIKSGNSYLAKDGNSFSVSVDQNHLDYWCSYAIPVILVCFSPSHNLAAWVSITEYVQHKKSPIAHIDLPLKLKFNCDALSEGITRLLNSDSYHRNQKNHRFLIDCIDDCLVGNARIKLQGLSILGSHPDSSHSRTTAFLARHLLFDLDLSVSNKAIYTLAFLVGRFRWGFIPNNSELKELIDYASELCHDFTAGECKTLIERVDDEWFHGPEAIGERVFDLLMCCEESQQVLEEIAANKNLPMERRINSLYMMYGCDHAELIDYRELADDPDVGDVYQVMYADEIQNNT